MMVVHSGYAYLEAVKNEQLLPRLWEQGSTKCCVFPVTSEKTICLFFESDLDNVEVYSRCEEYINLLQQNFESPASLSGGHYESAVGAERIGISH